MNAQENRIAYFDFLRGVAIFMVIGIHTYYLSSNTGLIGDINIFVRQIINCAVPLFLAISGYSLARKNQQDNYLSFLKKQVPKVYIPVLIWSLPYLVSALSRGFTSFSVFAYYFCCGVSIYYFIALIIQYYILFPILIKSLTKGGILISGLITFIAVTTVSYYINIRGANIPLLFYAGPFPIWLIFFVMGLWLGKRRERNYSLCKYVLLGG